MTKLESEAEAHWRSFLASLQSRRLHHGLTFIVSDAHPGLSAARTAVFPSVPWQRCQFHLQQNAQAYVPRLDIRACVAADIRSAFNCPDLPAAQARLFYLMVAIIHKELNLPGTLHRTLQLLSVHPFEKTTMHELLTENNSRHLEVSDFNQLMLRDL